MIVHYKDSTRIKDSTDYTYYNYCDLEADGTIAFGSEQGRQGGGHTLSSSWCHTEYTKNGKTYLRMATAEEYREKVKKRLAYLRDNEPAYYAEIISCMQPSHEAFLQGAPFEYKMPAIEAAREAEYKRRETKAKEYRGNLFNIPVATVFDYATKELKEI